MYQATPLDYDYFAYAYAAPASYMTPAPPPLSSIQVLGELSIADSYVAHHQQKTKRRSGYGPRSNNSDSDDGGPRADPFAPECSIPLPFQLGDEYGYYGPTAIWKRNERERHRVRCVNEGYEKLRQHLPLPDKDKRLSKVETLRLAIRYIHHLQQLLVDEKHDEICDCNLIPKSSPESDNDQNDSDERQEKRKRHDDMS